jgi:putative FmdB family regulatory protein
MFIKSATMPTYDYVCSKCDHQFEKSQSMNDQALTVCPKDLCGMKRWGKGKVKRAVGAGAGLIFKGSGFYITDYRSEGYKEAAKKDAPPAASPAGGDGKSTGTKVESKPAAKSENNSPKTKSAKE